MSCNDGVDGDDEDDDDMIDGKADDGAQIHA